MGMANKAFRKTSQRTQLVPLKNGLRYWRRGWHR
jgi:hypothetical protein